MDEHRIGLKPILRTVWARKGHRPIVSVRPRYQWLYLYGFVHPATGRTVFWLVSTVRSDIMTLVLAQFAAEVGASPAHPVVLVLDRAGWHTSKALHLPPGLTLEFLPPYSPELQPAERLWALTNEGVANQCFPDLAALQAAQEERCRALQAQPDRVRDRTLYHWWPAA